MDCLFCKIARKEIPAEVIAEDDRTVTFLDIQPRAPGHTVVVSKIHSQNLIDLPAFEIEPLFRAVQAAAARAVTVLKADGCTIGINQGRVSGQSVDHLHVHVLPRFAGDGGGSLHSVVDNPPQESVAEIAKRLRSNRE